MDALDELEERGKRTLDIYWLEDIGKNEDNWSVDVLQDELNERCGSNWTWTVMSEGQVKTDERNENRLPFWTIVTGEDYSEKAVENAVEDWLSGKGYEFDVGSISPEEAEGSGLLEKIEELEEEDLEPSEYKRLEDIEW